MMVACHYSERLKQASRCFPFYHEYTRCGSFGGAAERACSSGNCICDCMIKLVFSAQCLVFTKAGVSSDGAFAGTTVAHTPCDALTDTTS
jgi:hypothetical protein